MVVLQAKEHAKRGGFGGREGGNFGIQADCAGQLDNGVLCSPMGSTVSLLPCISRPRKLHFYPTGG